MKCVCVCFTNVIIIFERTSNSKFLFYRVTLVYAGTYIYVQIAHFRKTTAKRYDGANTSENSDVLDEDGFVKSKNFHAPISSMEAVLQNSALEHHEVLTIDDESPDILYNNGRPVLEDGTVVVQPVDASESLADAGASTVSEGQSRGVSASEVAKAAVLVSSSSAANTAGGSSNSSKRRVFSLGPLDKVKCTACAARVNPFHSDEDEIQVHPVLKTLICYNCFEFYGDGILELDVDGKENQCRWCGEGGTLICCDKCPNSFCKPCIRRNLGRTELQNVEAMGDDEEWHCYVCDPTPLNQLLQDAHDTLSAIEDHFAAKRKREANRKRTQSKRRLGQNFTAELSTSHSSSTPPVSSLTPSLSKSVGPCMPLNVTSLTAGVLKTAAGRQAIQKANLLQQQMNNSILGIGERNRLHPGKGGGHVAIGAMTPRQVKTNAMSNSTLANSGAGTRRPMQSAASAQSGIMTELWYKKNIHVADMLQEIEAVTVGQRLLPVP